MLPSAQTLVLTLTALAIGGAEGFRLRRRDNVSDTAATQGAQNVLVSNADQTQFYVAMQFGTGTGIVDTYSLVSTTRGDIILPAHFAPNVTGFVDQGKSVDEGPILSGPVSAVGWTVPDQDIICYNNSASVLPIDVDGQYGYAGFGIWPNTSTIAQTFGDWSADSFVARVLAEPNTGLFWTLLISPLEEDRGQDLSFGGILTIGEIVNLGQIFNISDDELKKDKIPDLKLVTEYPLLNNSAVCENETYYAFIDEISWGNGSATLNSSIPGTPKGKIAAYLDSLSPWNQVPYSVTKELYGNLQNATYVKESGLWFFDCVELSVNITIAGHAYPISPLTVAQHFEELICVGTFQAKPENVGGDVVLGVPFLKNVYARFSYQTRRDGEVFDPYVQLMPITDIEDAHHDWEVWYKNWSGNSTHNSTQPTHTPTHSPSPIPTPPPTPPSSSSSSPAANPPTTTGGNNKVNGAVEDDGETQGAVSKTVKRISGAVIGIIVGLVVLGLLLICGLFFAVRKWRKGRDGKGAYRGVEKTDDIGAHVPLYDAGGTSGRYGEGGQGRYTDPYKDS